ncbi:MAG: hypothetical protein B7Z44_05905 [Caulobacter sp. 12-67-6]|nr:MAG: hypothetical protein B7Z44_05905 [Caulobacter sp. 12-67-6]OYX68126.1 MAG: hypothetical protein B7Y81_17640 [Caulobacter sp. 32-67-35]HQR91292.1 hypothetical protein [Caulobacter sp.]
MTVQRLISAVALAALGLSLQGCLAAAAVGTVAGTAIGVTGAVVGGAAKVGGKAVVATGKAVIPGESAKDREKREYEEWKRSN